MRLFKGKLKTDHKVNTNALLIKTGKLKIRKTEMFH